MARCRKIEEKVMEERPELSIDRNSRRATMATTAAAAEAHTMVAAAAKLAPSVTKGLTCKHHQSIVYGLVNYMTDQASRLRCV